MAPPFSQTTNPRRHSSPLILNSGHLMFLFVITIFFVFIIPSFLSFDSQIFRPLLVAKKNCHSLNLVLVFFIIVCAFLSTNNNNNKIENTSSYHNQNPSIFYPSTPQRYTLDHYTNVSNSLPHLHLAYLRQRFHIGTQVSNNWDPSSDHPKQRCDWIQEEREESHFHPNNSLPTPPLPLQTSSTLPSYQSPQSSLPSLKAKAPKPMFPVKTSSFNSFDESMSSSSDSSFSTVLPPPLPPFEILPAKFKELKDYILINSYGSSSCGSPDSRDGRDSQTMRNRSPDVNAKAGAFITKIKAGFEKKKKNEEGLI